ncbi:MAG TPA: peptidase S8, partial [Roseiflexaceae bacterium]|nr:peptidase S8 [Roseiflexaceae bacterium]
LELGNNEIEEEVPLGLEFPFYGYTVTDTLVTSDGTLAFSLPNQQYSGPIGRCFPISEFHFFTIAPFRADLDPTRGGAVRYGTIDDGKTFVLSYENVPLHSGPDGATYTFQVLLHDDGRIVFQYRELAALPALLGVGIQRSPEDAQAIGCGPATPIADQLAIAFQPQLNATTWLDAPIDQGLALPTAQAEITATLHWNRPFPRGIQHGRIAISSNDPMRSLTIVSIHADMLPPPYEHLLILPGAPRR